MTRAFHPAALGLHSGSVLGRRLSTRWRQCRRARGFNRTLAWGLAAICAVLANSVAFHGQATVAAPPPAAELKRLLDMSWDSSLPARQTADEQFAKLRETHAADETLAYALALVKIKQRKYPEAAALIEQLSKLDPLNPDYLRPRIWLAVLLRKPEPAVAALNRYIAKFPPAPVFDPPADGQPADGQPANIQPAPFKAAGGKAGGVKDAQGKDAQGKDAQGKDAQGKAAGGKEADAAGFAQLDAENQRLDWLRFAGRIHGFLEGPGSGSGITEVALADYRKKLVAGLSEARKAAFLEGRDEVIDNYLGRKDDQDATREKFRRDQEQQRDERLVALEKEREQNERRSAELNSERTRLRSEMTDQLADLQRQERPLIDQFTRLETQAAPLRRELLFIDEDIARLEGILARERNPVIRDQILRDISRLEASGIRLQGSLDVVQRQASTLAAQRAELQRQSAQVQASIGRQLDSVEREQAGISKRARAADGEERRLRGATLGDSGQLRAMATQSSAFTTYVPYPIEEARQSLIDRLP